VLHDSVVIVAVSTDTMTTLSCSTWL